MLMKSSQTPYPELALRIGAQWRRSARTLPVTRLTKRCSASCPVPTSRTSTMR